MLTLVPTPIGNVEDITLRALRALSKAEIVLCEDTRVAKKLYRLLEERHGLEPRPRRFVSLHSHNEAETVANLPQEWFEAEVVYMSDAGMPCISDPGALLVRRCQERGTPYTVLPGPSAFVTAYAASGFAEPRFLFFGFLPHKGKDREEALRQALEQPWPVVLYEAPHRLEKLLKELEASAPKRKIFAAKELTKRHERYFHGTAEELLETIEGALAKGEWVLVIPPDPRKPGSEESVEEILAMDLPPKQKAKRLAQATGRSVAEWYDEIAGRGKNHDK